MPGEQNDLSTCMSDEQLKKAYEALAEFFQFDNHEQGFPVSSEGDDLNIGEVIFFYFHIRTPNCEGTIGDICLGTLFENS